MRYARNHTGHRIGETHGRAAHPDATVKAARELKDLGLTHRAIGARLCIGQSTIGSWLSYRTRWSA